MSETLTRSTKLITTSCWCGIALAIPDSLYRVAQEQGHEVYCPLGHTFVWHETENDKLRKRLERAEARATSEADQRKAAERSNTALRGEITKQKKRSAGGACPCCNRTFVQLSRHMKSQHPDYAS